MNSRELNSILSSWQPLCGFTLLARSHFYMYREKKITRKKMNATLGHFLKGKCNVYTTDKIVECEICGGKYEDIRNIGRKRKCAQT